MRANPDHRAGSDLTLAVNTAENTVQVAMTDQDGKMLFAQQVEARSQGVEILAQVIRHGLDLLGQPPASITRIAAVRGPGSFTGLRLAATTAAALARATGASQAGLDLMALVALQASRLVFGLAPNALIVSAVRARRDLVYLQAFVLGATTDLAPVPATSLHVATVTDGQATAWIRETALQRDPCRVFLAGSGVAANGELLALPSTADLPCPVDLLPVTGPGLEVLSGAALTAAYSPDDIEPYYVRSTDAQENLPRIAARLGMDPADAAFRLRDLTSSVPQA